jgi:trehalose 6-phosphate synthase
MRSMAEFFDPSSSFALLGAFLWGGGALGLGLLVRSLALKGVERLFADPDLLRLLSRYSLHWVWIGSAYAFLGNLPAWPIGFFYLYRVLDAYLILSATFVGAVGMALLARKFFHTKYPEIPLPAGLYTGLVASVGTVGVLILFGYLGMTILPMVALLAIGAMTALLAFQETLVNLSAGLHLFTERLFSVGDHIRLGSGEEGQVLAIQWRATRIQTPNGQVVIVPNRKVLHNTIFHTRPLQIQDAGSVREKLKSLLAGKPFVLVSNREPYIHERGPEGLQWSKPAGGLTAALDPLMQAVGGLWVAWGSGNADRESSTPEGKTRVPPDQPAYTLKRIWLDDRELGQYYAGYSNGVIWPLCHLALEKIARREEDWKVYQQVNERFAEGVVQEIPKDLEGALIWVHDYQLALVPQYLRKRSPSARICHFWHIPWPPFDVFRILPERKELLDGLLHADLIGFQIDRYRDNFIQCVENALGEKVGPDGVIGVKHRTVVKSFPISVDFDQFQGWAGVPGAREEMDRIRTALALAPDGFIGIGVDRLEYTKALVERFEALDLFFSRYPHYRGRFTFVQVAPSSRAEMEVYKEYAEKVLRLVDDVNRRHARNGWRPILFFREKLSHQTLALYYRLADLAIISSTADGMNLVAKEYVASQVDEKGVLLLSELAGASEQLDGAYLINPYDVEGLCESIRTALGAPPEVRRILMRGMREHVRAHTLYHWVGEIFSALEKL